MRHKLKRFPWKAYHPAPVEIGRGLSERIAKAEREVGTILALARRTYGGDWAMITDLAAAQGQLQAAQRAHVASLVTP